MKKLSINKTTNGSKLQVECRKYSYYYRSCVQHKSSSSIAYLHNNIKKYKNVNFLNKLAYSLVKSRNY